MFNANRKNEQPELFKDLAQMTKKTKKPKFHLPRIVLSLSFENLTILFIGAIMLLIVCYSLGVEKGKSLARLNRQSPLVQEQKVEPLSPVKEPEQKKENRQIMTVSKEYTIQVATFRKSSSVKQEMARLKNKGYAPFVISRDKFSEICVGLYANKYEATEDLKKLRKIYADCYMRNR